MRLYRTLPLLLMAFTFSVMLSAQIDYDKYPEVTSTFFINDVHIQKSPTDSFGLGDILIVDGRIAKMGRSLTAPPEAMVVEGDSAYVYPAFIDALSHAGISKSDSKPERPEVKFRGYPPNKAVGITPEAEAYEAVDPNNESIKKMKAAGFGLSHVVPRGSMLPGQSSLMLLDGESNEDMLMKEKLAMFFKLQGTRGFYPTTIIGVMAKWRDLYRQAEGHDRHKKILSSSPKAKRAKKNETLEALIPVTKGEMPVVMKTEKVKDIHRALALQKDLGYKLILAEVRQGWTLAERLKKENITVLLSAKLPKDLKDEKKKDGKKKKKGDDKKETESDKSEAGQTLDKMKDQKEKGKKAEEKKEEKKDPEVLALEAKKKASYEAYVAQAASFEKAGVPFAFSFLESKPEDLKKSLNKMMEAGLSKSAALAAVTTNAAEILGVSSEVGTLETNKLANLFLCDAPYFDEDSNIKALFVEGRMTEFEVKKKKKKGDGKTDGEFSEKLVGKWDYEVETPDGKYTGKIIISGEDQLSITVTNDEDASDIMEARDIETDEGTLTFTMDIDMGTTIIPGEMELNFDGESFSGSVSIEGMGSMPISGDKISGPDFHHSHHNHNDKAQDNDHHNHNH